MNALRGVLTLLGLWTALSFLLVLAYGIARARHHHDHWPELAEWEAHVASTPGIGDFYAWEQEMSDR